MLKRLMTPEEVADVLGVPVSTLYAWRHRGVGPKAARVGRHLRYSEDDLRGWLDERSDDHREAV